MQGTHTPRKTMGAAIRKFRSMGPNFMTPTIVKYGETDDHFYEISQGESGMTRDLIFGVTSLDARTLEHEWDVNRPIFTSEAEADEWAKDNL